ncbi:MAG: hypothetical protein LBD21_04275 [Tannerellaceae bacterium]|jgi:hypothetical protein|nr:hypothetical protein [Tannerellaceae bacterium]
MNKEIRRDFELSISSIFRDKGTTASIAEKAFNNVRGSSIYKLYYFTVQHSFKQLDAKELLFGIDEETSEWTKYLSLGFKRFTNIKDELHELIENLRNLNSHYLHSFDFLREDLISPAIIAFLKESFRLAVVQSFINEKTNEKAEKQIGIALTTDEKKEIVEQCLSEEDKIIDFLKTMFYQSFYVKAKEFAQKQQDNKERIRYINQMFNTLDNAIDYILFVNAEDDLEWALNYESKGGKNNYQHIMLTIKKGRYLSFNAMLFLFSMFLYKNEANQLIPRISGFKKNGTTEDQRKLNVFLFYAKKFSSQDIDSEHKKLVFFRDIIQYLNKFPLEWNRALEANNPSIVENFKNEIYKMEIEREFPTLVEDSDFVLFAQKYLKHKISKSDKKNPNMPLYSSLIEKERTIFTVYNDIKENKVNDSKEYKDPENYKCFILNHLMDLLPDNKTLEYVQESSEEHKEQHTKMFNECKRAQKLENRISQNLIIPSYARNQDRFMEFGIRYLAEINYFGEDAQFKMYRFYTSQEQSDSYLDSDDQELDKLKFKGGKEVIYSTYKASLTKYPEWDTPFVVENNAFFVKLKDDPRPIAIQRNLLIYFLEDALFHVDTVNRGKDILGEYVDEELDITKEMALKILKENNSIDSEQKKIFKRILPRRLLNHYCAAQHNYSEKNPQPATAFRKILERALAREKRYDELLKQAERENRKKIFLDKNKGKNFKLTFIRKACHIMYFKNIYKQKSMQLGHHESLHITRDEFNDFCQWMYAFDRRSSYKILLKKLFEDKCFFENEEFHTIFMRSQNLDDFYKRVKSKYEAWLPEHENEVTKGKHDLDSYDKLLHKGVRYINVKHFKDFLVKKRYMQTDDNGKFKYSSLENKDYLLPCFYLQICNDKRLLFDLHKAKHEDCLLYEIALKYFNEERNIIKQAKAPVHKILSQDIEFRQQYKDNGQQKEYTVIVPFKNVDKWLEIQTFNVNLLKRLPLYLNKHNTDNKKGKNDLAGLLENNKIALSDFSKVNNHIINHQAKFTNCIIALEEFYIWKNKLVTQGENRLDIGDIAEIKSKYTGLIRMRNVAMHFDLPMSETYNSFFTNNIEMQFANELNFALTYDTLPDMHKKVLKVFRKEMRNDLFDKSKIYAGNKRNKPDVQSTENAALEKYFKELINKKR